MLLVAAPLASYIPMPVLAAILMLVAWNMGEWREIPELLKLSRADIAVWLVTFALTVLADLTVAVEVGMILASLLFIRNVVRRRRPITEVTDDDVEDGRVHVLQDKQIPDYVAIFRIHGPFLFGATDKLDAISARIRRAAADRRPAAAEHDGHRRHRPGRARGSRRRAARVGPRRCCSAARASSRAR